MFAGGTDGCSGLVSQVFRRICLRDSWFGGLSAGGSSCPVMSSSKKSPSCNNRSPRSLMCFRDVFMGCLVVLQ